MMQRQFIAFGISFPRGIVEKIEAERGDIPRSRYVCRMLEKSYSVDANSKRATGPKSKKSRQGPLDIRQSSESGTPQ